jgi:hypothetical protein
LVQASYVVQLELSLRVQLYLHHLQAYLRHRISGHLVLERLIVWVSTHYIWEM